MSTRDQQPAPMLAAEEQQRGDNAAKVIAERLAAGQSVEAWKASARNAYSNAARYGEQPEEVA